MTEFFHRSRHNVVGYWKHPWKVSAPHKALNLLWRICRGCVPTRVTLRSWYVPCYHFCSLCDNASEDD